MDNNYSDDSRTLWVGNIDNRVTEEILWELFLQAGPLESVKIPKDHRTGKQKNFGFVKFLHESSVKYVIALMNGIPLYRTPLRLDFKSKPSGPNRNSENGYESTPKRRRMNENDDHHMPHDEDMDMNFPGYPSRPRNSPMAQQFMPPPPPHRMPMNFDRRREGPHRGSTHSGTGSPHHHRNQFFENGDDDGPIPDRHKHNMGMRRSYSMPQRDEERRPPRRRDHDHVHRHSRR